MSIATKVPSGLWVRWLGLGLFCAAAGGVSWSGSGRAAEAFPAPIAETVKALQKRYEAEREAATKADLAKMFSPQLVKQADKLAKKAQVSLKAGRFLQASEALRQARWLLPSLPLDLPKHVARIFGNPKLRHANEVRGLSYSPDGKRLATASADGTVKVWDMANGKELLTYRGHNDYVRTVAFSPNGKMIASAGGERIIHLWDGVTGQDIRTFKHPNEPKKNEENKDNKQYVLSISFSPDGKKLASGWEDEHVRVYDVKAGNMTTDITSGRNALVAAVAYSPNGKQLGAVIGEGTLQIWDTTNQNLMMGIVAQAGSCTAIAYSPDSTRVATCGSEGIKVFTAPVQGQATSTEPLRTIASQGKDDKNYTFTCVAFSRDNKTLAAGATDNVVRLFDVDTGEPAGTFPGHSDEVKAIAFNPAGNELASASADHTVRLWHVETVQQARDLAGHKAAVWSAEFSPDGLHVVSGGADRTVKIWDTATGQVIKTLKGHKSAITTVLYSPDGKYILSCGGDRVLKLWDAASGDLVRTFEGHESAVTAAAFNKDSDRIVSGGADRLVIVWDTAKGTALHTLKDNKVLVAAVAFSPDGKQIASGNVDQTITLWNAQTGKLIKSWSAHGAAVSALAYSPNGEWLVSGGADNLVRLWRTTELGANPITLIGHTGPVSAVAFSANSRFLASGGSDQQVKIWQLEGGGAKEVRDFRGHKDWISAVAFSRDGNYVLSASVDKLVKIWEITSREVAAAAEHTGEVNALAVSPNGKYLASGGTDKTIKVWDLNTGAELFTLSGHSDAVTALIFTPDSKMLISSARMDSKDNKGLGEIRLWNPATGKEIAKTEPQNVIFNNLVKHVPAIGLSADGQNIMLWFPAKGKKEATNVSIYDLAKGNQILNIHDEGRDVNCLAFSANGKRVAMGALDGGVRIFNVDKKGEREPGGDWPVHKKEIGDLVFTPDGKTLITGGQSGQVKIWNVADRSLLHDLKNAHKDRISAFAMSPDGKRFASTSVDNTVKVWDVKTGQELRKWEFKYPVQEGNSFVHNLIFTADGKYVVTGNADTTMYLLELPE